MKKLIYCLLVLAFCFSACGDDQENFVGSDNIVTEARGVDDFVNIDINSVINVNVTRASIASLIVKANDNIIKRVETKIQGNTLIIDLEEGNYENVSIDVDVKIPDVSAINIEGTGNLFVSEFEDLDQIAFESVGTGNITAQGIADNLSVELTGTGSFNGFEFVAKKVRAGLTGTGNIEVFCTEDLEGSISGTGNIYYKGNPDIDVDVSGTGKVINAN